MEKIESCFPSEKIDKIKPILAKYPSFQDRIIDYFLVHKEKLEMFHNETKRTYDRDFIIDNNDPEMLDDISRCLGILFPIYSFGSETGLFGKCSNNETVIEKTVSDLKEQGYSKFEFLLDEKRCDNLIKKLSSYDFTPKKSSRVVKGIQLDNPLTTTHWIKSQQDVANTKEVQELITDPTILEICQRFLETTPINSQTNSWWSVAHKNQDSTHMFHQDCEDVKFVKVFLYLNDVSHENGPHVYARGSRNNIKKPNNKYRVSNRVPENFIKQNYHIDELTGKKGTLLFVNTHGYHKGKSLTKGHRILVQLEFNSTYMYPMVSLKRFPIQPQNKKIDKFIKHHHTIYHKYLKK